MRVKTIAALFFSAAWGLGACSEDSKQFRGRLFVAPITNQAGATVGLSVDYIPEPGSNADVESVEVEVRALGVTFPLLNGASCIRMSSAGRLGLLADGQLSLSSRIALYAHAPAGAGGGGDTATGGGTAMGGHAGELMGGSATQPPDESPNQPTCSGDIIDDAVWPTLGAEVVPIAVGGSTGSGGTASGGALAAAGGVSSAGGSTNVGGSSNAGGSASGGSSSVGGKPDVMGGFGGMGGAP